MPSLESWLPLPGEFAWPHTVALDLNTVALDNPLRSNCMYSTMYGCDPLHDVTIHSTTNFIREPKRTSLGNGQGADQTGHSQALPLGRAQTAQYSSPKTPSMAALGLVGLGCLCAWFCAWLHAGFMPGFTPGFMPIGFTPSAYICPLVVYLFYRRSPVRGNEISGFKA